MPNELSRAMALTTLVLLAAPLGCARDEQAHADEAMAEAASF